MKQIGSISDGKTTLAVFELETGEVQVTTPFFSDPDIFANLADLIDSLDDLGWRYTPEAAPHAAPQP